MRSGPRFLVARHALTRLVLVFNPIQSNLFVPPIRGDSLRAGAVRISNGKRRDVCYLETSRATRGNRGPPEWCQSSRCTYKFGGPRRLSSSRYVARRPAIRTEGEKNHRGFYLAVDPEAWFRRVIDEVRAGEVAFDPEELRAVRGVRLLEFGPPCQVRTFHLVEPTAFFTLIMRVATGPDKDVQVTRPLRLWELYDELERVASEPLWDAPLARPHEAVLAPGEEATFRPVVEQTLAYAYQHARQLPFMRPRKDEHGMVSSVAREGSAWWLHDDVTSLDPVKFAAKIVRGTGHEIEAMRERLQAAAARAQNAPKEPQRFPRARKEKYPGWGVWWYPRIRVGPRPKTGLWQRLNSNSFTLGEARLVASHDVAPGRRAVATYEGFVGIIDDDPDVKKSAKPEDWLNALAYCFGEGGVDSYTVLEGELIGFEWLMGDGEPRIAQRMMPHTYRTASSQIEEMFPGEISHISVPDFLEFASAASEVLIAGRLRHARLIVEAATQLRRGHATESFFHSWLLVEQLVNESWDAYVKREGFPRRRKDRLADPQQWNAEAKLEVLELAGVLEVSYDKAMALKKPRNQILHGLRAATDDQARAALSLARESLRQRLCLRLPPSSASAADECHGGEGKESDEE